MTKPEVAVFGGSFNPPHVAHVLAMSWVLSATRAEKVVVVPTFQHPFGKALVAFDHRVRMAELAFEPLRRVEVSRIEEELGGDSFTVRTLQALAARQPDVQLRLVVGEDAIAESHRWREFDRIKELAPLVVLGRTGYEAAESRGITLPQVSSSHVRECIARGVSIAGHVPATVLDYIAAHGLYANEGTAK